MFVNATLNYPISTGLVLRLKERDSTLGEFTRKEFALQQEKLLNPNFRVPDSQPSSPYNINNDKLSAEKNFFSQPQPTAFSSHQSTQFSPQPSSNYDTQEKSYSQYDDTSSNYSNDYNESNSTSTHDEYVNSSLSTNESPDRYTPPEHKTLRDSGNSTSDILDIAEERRRERLKLKHYIARE